MESALKRKRVEMEDGKTSDWATMRMDGQER